MVSYEKAQSEVMTNSEFDGKTHLSGTTANRGSTTKWPVTMPFFDTDLKKWYKNSGTESVPVSVEIGATGSAYDICYKLSTTIGDYSLTPASATATSEYAGTGITTLSFDTVGTTLHCNVYAGQPRGGQRITDTGPRGKKIDFVKFHLSKTGSPTGTGYSKVRKTSDDSVVATAATTIDVSTIAGSRTEYTFTYAGETLPSEEFYVTFEFSGGSAGNEIAMYGGSGAAGSHFSFYDSSWHDNTGLDYRGELKYYTTAARPATATYDGSTSTYWMSNSEANPAIYWDFTSNRKFIAFAINLNTTDTTISTMELSLSTDTTFSGEVKRTLLESDFTNNTWRFILINIQETDTRYVQLKGSGTGVLSVYEFKARATTDTSPGFSHFHNPISTSSTAANSNDSN